MNDRAAACGGSTARRRSTDSRDFRPSGRRRLRPTSPPCARADAAPPSTVSTGQADPSRDKTGHRPHRTATSRSAALISPARAPSRSCCRAGCGTARRCAGRASSAASENLIVSTRSMNHNPFSKESPHVRGRAQSQAFCPISPEPCKLDYFKSAKSTHSCALQRFSRATRLTPPVACIEHRREEGYPPRWAFAAALRKVWLDGDRAKATAASQNFAGRVLPTPSGASRLAA